MISHALRRPQMRALPATRLPPEAIGIAAGLGAATIWGGAIAMTRLGVGDAGTLGPQDVVLLRFLAPAALLLPVVLRVLPRLAWRDLPRLVALLAGGGAPFVLLVGAGLREAAAADAGALLPGTVPLWVALASLAAGGRISSCQRLGLALIAVAVALVAGPALVEPGSWRGILLLLAAAWLAALYTLALRGIGLAPIEVAALVSLLSVLGFAPFYLLAGEPGLVEAGWAVIATQSAWQGGLAGMVGPVAFAIAVARLGPARAACFGALSPVAAALFGLLLLGEVPDGATALGLAAAALGVALSAGGAGRGGHPSAPSRDPL